MARNNLTLVQRSPICRVAQRAIEPQRKQWSSRGRARPMGTVVFAGLLLLLTTITTTSCRTTRYVPLPEIRTRDSVRVSNSHRLDSIRMAEWHFVFQKGDTVFKTDSVVTEKIVEVEVHDTITNNIGDSIPYPVEVPIEVPAPIPRFYIRCTIGFWLIIIGFLLYIAMRLYLRR